MKKPQIRFKGFSGDWDSNILLNLCDFSKGKGYIKKDLKPKGQEIILYGYLYTNYKPYYDTFSSFTKLKNNSVLSKGNEIVIPASGETAEEIARASYIKKPNVIIGGDLNIVRPNNYISPLFLSFNITYSSCNKDIVRQAQGKTVVHIHQNNLEIIKVSFPSYEEQVKIGELFSKLDSDIENQEIKLEKLRNIKKACLYKMFPQEGETVPKMRFKGFNAPWHKESLMSCSTYESSSISLDKYDHSLNYNYILYDASGISTKLKEYKMSCPYISIIKDGSSVGRINLCKAYSSVLGTMGYILPKENIELNFLYYSIYDRNLSKYIIGATIPHIYYKDYCNEILFIPSLKEQKKIADFFTKLDNLIENQEKKITQLKNIKKSLLSKMFI